MTLVLWILAVYGLTFLLADASIFDRPRAWACRVSWFASLLKCYFCVGFWCALALYVIRTPPCLQVAYWVDTALWVFAGTAGSYVLSKLVDLIDAFVYATLNRDK